MVKNIKKITMMLIVALLFSMGVENVFASSKIELTGIEIESKSSTADASISDFSSDKVETNIVYHKFDDYVVFKLTIHNNDSKDYIIESITNNNSNDYIEYEYEDYKNTVLRGNKDITVLIKSKYVNELTDIDLRDQDNTVKFTINFMNEDGDPIDIDIDFNPATGDSIYLYLEVLGLSVILILLVLLIISKNDSDRIKKIFLMILTYAIMTPVCLKALEIGVSITFNNDIELHDKVKVTYEANGETSTSVIEYNTKAEEKTAPDRNGFRFDGWFLGESKYNFETNVVEDITLVAKYTKVVYNITYHMDGGNAANPGSYNIGELPIILNNPEKEGYDFTGWTDIDGNTSEVVVITNEARDLEFTANYSLKEYQLTYNDVTNAEKAAMNNPTTYTINDSITLNNPENRNDNDGDLSLKFVGWKDASGSISKTVTIANSKEDKEYTATWIHVRPDTYSIIYHLDDGTINGGTNPNEYTKITETFTLINPERGGFKFVGWTGSNGETPSKTVTIEQGSKGDLEYFAHFEEFSYDIVYDLDGGDATNPTTYKVTDTFTLNNPEKRGYRFIGWTGTGLSGLTQDVTIPLNSTGNRSYKANYEVIKYNINYVLNDGVVSGGTNKDKYTVEETFTLYNPTKEGHIFEGWTGSNGDTPEKEVTITNEIGEKEYVANFTPNSYTIKFKKNDSAATGEMEDLPMSYGVEKNLTPVGFEKADYKFVKWTTNKDGTGDEYTDQQPVINLALEGTVTLYAQWKQITKAKFTSGSTINVKMKTLSGQSGATKDKDNTIIKKVKYFEDFDNMPDEYKNDDYKISESTIPIYMWFDGTNGQNIIYYASPADVIETGTDASYMFARLRSATEIDTNFTTDNATNMTQMFFGCQSLPSLDVSHFKTGKVTNMTSMFGELKSIEGYDIKGWDVSNVKYFNFLFNSNEKVVELDLTGWNTKSANNMQNMFSSMYALKTLKISTFNTKTVQFMNNMFDNERSIESLDLSHFDTSNVTKMSKMFYNMYELTELNITSFDTSKVQTMENMFIGTRKIEVLDLSSFNTANVTTFKNMFSDMTALKTILVSDKFVTTKQTSTPIMFKDCNNLVGGNQTSFAVVKDNTSRYALIDRPGQAGYFTEKQ